MVVNVRKNAHPSAGLKGWGHVQNRLATRIRKAAEEHGYEGTIDVDLFDQAELGSHHVLIIEAFNHEHNRAWWVSADPSEPSELESMTPNLVKAVVRQIKKQDDAYLSRRASEAGGQFYEVPEIVIAE